MKVVITHLPSKCYTKSIVIVIRVTVITAGEGRVILFEQYGNKLNIAYLLQSMLKQFLYVLFIHCYFTHKNRANNQKFNYVLAMITTVT